MKNSHDHEKLLSLELKQELSIFAEKIADIMSPVYDIFVIGFDHGVLTVINTSGGVLSVGRDVYPLVFNAMLRASIYKKAAILEYINNYFAAMLSSSVEQRLSNSE